MVLTPLVELKSIKKNYKEKTILDLSLTLYEKESLAVLGANGSGKSTLLRMIGGLILPNKGRVIHRENIEIGFVPEDFPKHLPFTPTEYLLRMGKIRRLSSSFLHNRINELLALFQLQHASQQRMENFSKGMLQKVAIMQAILYQPDLLILDEPLSGLDIQSQQDFINILGDLKEQGITLILSVHEPSLLNLVDRFIVLKKGRIHIDRKAEDFREASMVIEATVPETISIDFSTIQKGAIRTIYRDKDYLELFCIPAHSDEVLMYLLQKGASIRSVNYYEPLLEWTK